MISLFRFCQIIFCQFIGHIVRTRSCKPSRQCIISSVTTQWSYCFSRSCVNNYRKHLNVAEKNTITHSIDYKLRYRNLNVAFIFLFPFFFTIICLPLCICYYIYEFDFKLHALTIHILSLCNRRCQMTSK